MMLFVIACARGQLPQARDAVDGLVEQLAEPRPGDRDQRSHQKRTHQRDHHPIYDSKKLMSAKVVL